MRDIQNGSILESMEWGITEHTNINIQLNHSFIIQPLYFIVLISTNYYHIMKLLCMKPFCYNYMVDYLKTLSKAIFLSNIPRLIFDFYPIECISSEHISKIKRVCFIGKCFLFKATTKIFQNHFQNHNTSL